MRIRNSILNLLLCIVLFSNISRNQQKANVTTDLEALFHNSPSSAKPYAWRHWMGSNFSVILITKDEIVDFGTKTAEFVYSKSK